MSVTTEWKHIDGTYQLTAQTPAVDLTARLMADGKNVSGTLQIHNLAVAAFVSAHDAAYPLLTSSASTSSDGRKLYLMVFNKSASDSIPTNIHLPGFSAAKAQYWEVTGPSLIATTGVRIAQETTALSLSNATNASSRVSRAFHDGDRIQQVATQSAPCRDLVTFRVVATSGGMVSTVEGCP